MSSASKIKSFFLDIVWFPLPDVHKIPITTFSILQYLAMRYGILLAFLQSTIPIEGFS